MAFALIHERLQAVRTEHRRAEFLLCTLLWELKSTGLFRERGHSSVAQYAEVELGLAPRMTQVFVRVGQRLRRLPEVTRAFAEGALSYTQVREIARVATAETEAAWVERAQGSTSRELEAQVSVTTVGELPPDATALPLRPVWVRRTYELEAAEAEVLDRVVAVLRQMGEYDESVEDGHLLACLAQRFLAEPPPEAPVTVEGYRVVINECPTCQTAHVGSGHEVSDAMRGEAACDAEVVDLRTGDAHLHSRLPEPRRRKVMHKHGNRCIVPHCRARLWLHVHHVVFQSQGGTHGEANLVPCCGAHHRQIHNGVLTAIMTGAGIRFFRRDGTPFGSDGAQRPGLADEVRRVLGERLLFPHEVQQALRLPEGRAEGLLSMLRAQGAAFEDETGRWGRVDRLVPAAPTWARETG